MCRAGVRKAKANVGFSLMKVNKNGLYISSRRKDREDVGLLVTEAEHLVTNNVEKVNSSFISVR